MGTKTVLFLFLVFLLFFFSCSGEPPAILQILWQLNIVLDVESEDVFERLSLFVHVEDGDGIEDVETIYLLHDESELFWELESADWETYEENGETWFGSNELLVANNAAFPRGTYRIVVIDKAGERNRDELYINSDPIDSSKMIFPQIRVNENILTIKSNYADHTLRFYDQSDSVVKVFFTDAKEFDLGSILSRQEMNITREVEVHTFDSTAGYGVVTGAFDLSEKAEESSEQEGS